MSSSCPLNSSILNHISPTLGSLVTSVMEDSLTTIMISPILAYVSSKARANYLVTSLSKPLNFSINPCLCTCSNICLIWGYPSINFFPLGSVGKITPMVLKSRLTMLFVIGLWIWGMVESEMRDISVVESGMRDMSRVDI